jgi:hypothetical protein
MGTKMTHTARVDLADLEGIIVGYASQYARTLDASGVKPPYAALVSLLDVEGRELLQGEFPTASFPEDLPSATLTRARYEFGECVVESAPQDEQGVRDAAPSHPRSPRQRGGARDLAVSIAQNCRK